MEAIRTVVIGYGGMGSKYVQILYEGKVDGMVLTGICCRNQPGQEEIRRLYPEISVYRDTSDTFDHADQFDAVVIVTPHTTHVGIGKQAAAHKKHILCDKPLGTTALEARELLMASQEAGVALAAIFNTRANIGFRTAKEILDTGRLGTLSRAVWVCNTFYRTPVYHHSAPWRSTWKGERGGLLINQCQHYLDIWLWLFGLPSEINAELEYGRFNEIEVDDNVDLRFKYDNGLRGNLISSTGETPGTNRLEIWGTKGRLTIEHGLKVTLDENQMSTVQYGRENTDIYGSLPYKTMDLTKEQDMEHYAYVFSRFADHLRKGEPLLADGRDGLNSLSVANAAYLSSWLEKSVTFPLDDKLYAGMLAEKCR